jgi:hypothetical protein
VFYSCTTEESYTDTFAGFGPLSAGTYSYEIIFVLDGYQFARSTQPLVVTSVPNVPMLSSTALAVLGVLLSIIALIAMRR